MDNAALDQSGELATELAANDEAARFIDPRTVPVRYSTLKMFSQSPAHYLHAVQRGYDETLSMRIGSGAHAILFGQPYVTWTGKTRNGKVWDAFQQEHKGQLILSRTEEARSQAIAEAIRANDTAMRVLFTDTKLETRIDWEWQGRAFRSTPDAASRRHVADLKCLKSASPEEIPWASRKMHYHAQAALYRRALNETGAHIKDSYLVVVENKPPHLVTVLRFTPNALEQGDRETAAWLEQLKTCEASGSYPGYVQGVIDLDVPVTESDLIFDDDDNEGDE